MYLKTKSTVLLLPDKWAYMKTSTVWKKGLEFESIEKMNRIQLDSDGKAGFSPKALLLSALATCSAIDVVEILTKMRVEFSDLRVDVEADQSDGHPRVFRDFHMTFLLKTDSLNEEKVKKAIDLSLEKYCGVAAMLRKHSDIHYKIVLT